MAAIASFEVHDLGEDGSQYFPGDTATFSEFEHAQTGVGDTAREALEDALESLAQADIEVTAAQEAEMRACLDNPDKSAFESLDHSECNEDHDGDDWNHYVSIRYTLINGYHDCDCCGEIIIDARLCAACTEADCAPNRENVYDDCQRPEVD
jgi:hypothetical protein